MSRKRLIATLVLTVAAGGLFASWYFAWFVRSSNRGDRLTGPDDLYSNIMPDDYVGPETCAKCHEEQYGKWAKHPHRFMNQMASKAAVKGDFDDHKWTIRPGFTVTFSTKDNEYLMTVDRPARPEYKVPRTVYKVTRTIGSRFMQYYVGLQIEGEEPRTDRVYTTEHRLPFAYWFRLKRWLPIDYFDVGENWYETLTDDLPVVPGVDAKPGFMSYGGNCVHCHNTYPHAYRIFKPSLAGFPDANIEGDFKPLSAALAPRIKVAPTADDFHDLPHAIDYKKELVTVGISCESCHFGGREHALASKPANRPPSFFPTNPHVHVTAVDRNKKPFEGRRDDPATSQGTCAQCHSAGVAAYPNGAKIRNSSEARDMLSGGCATKIRCVDCHEPHTPGVPSGGPTPKAHLDACVSCHTDHATEEHSKHPLGRVDCMDCHMPRISQGVDVLSRTHRISKPVEQSMISAGAPNACNLCHVEKSVNWTLRKLKENWNKEVVALEGTKAELLEKPAGEVWLNSETSITRIVAVDAYARSSRWKTHLPKIMTGMNDHIPANRIFSTFSLERRLGRHLTSEEYEVRMGPKRRQEQLDWLKAEVQKK